MAMLITASDADTEGSNLFRLWIGGLESVGRWLDGGGTRGTRSDGAVALASSVKRDVEICSLVEEACQKVPLSFKVRVSRPGRH